MAVLLYFGMILCVLLFGSIVLGVTFYHWFKELRLRLERATDPDRGGS